MLHNLVGMKEGERGWGRGRCQEIANKFILPECIMCIVVNLLVTGIAKLVFMGIAMLELQLTQPVHVIQVE